MMLDAALAYVSHGFKVFPVKPDKTPLTTHGLKDCTMTQAGVKEYWTKWPDAGIGLLTDGLVVLDFDVKNNGLESKELIEQKYGELPATRVHQTGGGGYHYIYKNPNGSDIRNTVCLGGFKGVDLRANGGYIVAPPSPHISGNRYEVLEKTEIAPAPEWLVELATAKAISPAAPLSEDAIPDGQRNQTLTSLAGTMRRRGMSYAAIVAALKATKCQTPLTDRELETIAKSVARYQPDPIASLTDKTETLDVNTEITEMLGVDTETTEQTLITEKTEEVENNLNRFNEQRTGRVIWPMVDKWLQIHKGERFDLDTICRQLTITDREHRNSVARKLAYEVSTKKLEKSVISRPPLYRYIDNTIIRMNWLDVKATSNLDLQWPQGTDASLFGYDGRIWIPQKGLIVIAGVTNTGKSVWCRNFLWRNMDTYSCIYFSSETSEEDFADYASRMTWANPLKEDGSPKFELVWRNKDFKDVINPDGINIIDWLNLGDNFYQIGTVLEGIKEKLNTGICVIAIQKDPNKEMGMGGMWGEHLASLYMTMDFGRLTVKKAKKWHDWNPNNQTWGFDVVDRGVHFHNIRLLKKCGHCWQGKSKGQECQVCFGTGFVDADKMC